jgi:transposase
VNRSGTGATRDCATNPCTRHDKRLSTRRRFRSSNAGQTQMRDLASKGWGAKRIARELGVARNTVRRYLRGGSGAEVQCHPTQRRLDSQEMPKLSRCSTAWPRTKVVVAEMLAQRGIEASVRTVQRGLAERRREQVAAALATVRFETAPGRQTQIDFGERWVWIGGEQVTVHFFAAVLSYSRRIFVEGVPARAPARVARRDRLRVPALRRRAGRPA